MDNNECTIELTASVEDDRAKYIAYTLDLNDFIETALAHDPRGRLIVGGVLKQCGELMQADAANELLAERDVDDE